MDQRNTNKQFRIYDINHKFIRLSVDETIARNLNRWKTWSCSAGTRGLYIDYDGNVWVCNTASSKLDRFNREGWQNLLKQLKPQNPQMDWWPIQNKLAIDFRKTKDAFKKTLTNTIENKNKYPGFLGNIFEEIDLPNNWFDCVWDSCACGADVILSKAKNENFKEILSVTNTGFLGRDQTISNFSDEIQEPVAVEMNFPIPYQILWDLGRRCNYDCSYCWSSVHNRTEEHKDYDTVIRVINKLITSWSKNNQIRWNFGGGEPTLHHKFIDIIKYLKSNNQWTMVTSNGTRDYKYWKEAVKYLNSINLSAHFDGLKDDKDEDRFIKNIETICEHFDMHNDDYWLEIKIMTPPNYFERALSLREKIKNVGCLDKLGANNRIKGYLSLVPIRSLGDSGELVKYTEDQINVFRNQ